MQFVYVMVYNDPNISTTQSTNLSIFFTETDAIAASYQYPDNRIEIYEKKTEMYVNTFAFFKYGMHFYG
jgi:hypothetical protein